MAAQLSHCNTHCTLNCHWKRSKTTENDHFVENLLLFQLQYNAHWHKFMLRQPTKSANLWFVLDLLLSFSLSRCFTSNRHCYINSSIHSQKKLYICTDTRSAPSTNGMLRSFFSFSAKTIYFLIEKLTTTEDEKNELRI